MRLKGKVAIISGAASGLGASAAEICAREGCAVLIADIQEDKGREVARKIALQGGTAAFQYLDVTDENAWTSATETALQMFGKLDVVVNNAGLSGVSKNGPLDIPTFDRLLAVNLRGVFLGLRAGIATMKERGGSIINISSIGGIVGTPGTHLAYNTSKGGIRALTKAAAAEFGPLGIRVNSIHPGLMPPMGGVPSGDAARAKLAESKLPRVPLRRFGEVQDVGHAVAFLASDEAAYITGAELYVDGGYLAA